MMDYYILDGKEPVKVSDVITWATWFETASRKVKHTILSQGVEVSTVFLGLDHQWGEGPPLLFETMVFGGKHDQDQWRYPTWDEAIEGHDGVVDKLTWGCLLPLIQWLRQFKVYWSD